MSFATDDPRMYDWPSVEDPQSACDECEREVGARYLVNATSDGITYRLCSSCYVAARRAVVAHVAAGAEAV